MANVETIKSICNDKVFISFTSIHLPIFPHIAAVFVRHNLFVYFCSSLYLFLCLLLFNKTVWAHQWDSNLNDCCEWQARWPCNRCHDGFIYSLSCLSLFNTLSFLIPLYLCICFFVFIIKISPVSYHPESFSVYLSSTIFLFLSILLCVNVSFNPFCYLFSSLSKSSLSSTSKRAELEIFFRHLQAPNVTHRLESVKITFSIKFRRNATSGQS